MYRRLDETTLGSGERMEIGVVQGPDPEWLPRIAPFLGHKRDNTRAHIRRALEEPLDGLQTRFYVGTVADEIVSQIMVVGDRGVGIVGHVFTRPEHRRKGACAALMERQMVDCHHAGFQLLCLGTGFETPPYWIYYGFGFRSVAPGAGRMKWLAEPDVEDRLFAPRQGVVRQLQWRDWSWVMLLGPLPLQEDEELPRSRVLGVKTQESAESAFVSLQLRREGDPSIQAHILESAAGSTVGWAFLLPDQQWFGDVWTLDLFAHPGYSEDLPQLLDALKWPEAPVAAYISIPEGPRSRALRTAGFHPAAVLPGWLVLPECCREVALWTRGPLR